MKKAHNIEKLQQILRAELNFAVPLHQFLFVTLYVEPTGN